MAVPTTLAQYYAQQASRGAPTIGNLSGSSRKPTSSTISFGSSGLPSYITDAIKPSPTTSTSTRDRVRDAMQQDKKASQPIIREATGSQLDRFPDLSSVNTMEPGTGAPSGTTAAGPKPGSVISDAVGKVIGSAPGTGSGSTVGGGSAGGGSSSGGGGSSAGGGGSSAAPESEQITEEEANLNAEDTEMYNQLLDISRIEFENERADRLRQLRNLETELFGGGGTLEQTEFDQEQGRRRLAAQMAGRGTLQGGAYAGGERGLGTLQQRSQDYQIQNLIRPFQQQTDTDMLYNLGIGFDPAEEGFGGIFSMMPSEEFDWTTTEAGRLATAQARQRAFEALLSGLVTV